jgi:hypothetical protein
LSRLEVDFKQLRVGPSRDARLDLTRLENRLLSRLQRLESQVTATLPGARKTGMAERTHRLVDPLRDLNVRTASLVLGSGGLSYSGCNSRVVFSSTIFSEEERTQGVSWDESD